MRSEYITTCRQSVFRKCVVTILAVAILVSSTACATAPPEYTRSSSDHALEMEAKRLERLASAMEGTSTDAARENRQKAWEIRQEKKHKPTLGEAIEEQATEAAFYLFIATLLAAMDVLVRK